MTEHAELPLTAWAVLGMLSFGRELSGYDLKKWADSSLRFFYWSPASSQIYAELRRLERVGYVESRIAGAKRLERRRQREQAALDQLRERHTFPLPEGVVEHEVEHLMREYAENLASRGVDLEQLFLRLTSGGAA